MGEVFAQKPLAGAQFRNIDMAGATFEGAWLKGATIMHSCLRDVRMTAVDVGGMTIDGIRVDQLLEAEKDKRDPRRMALRLPPVPTVAEVRKAVATLEGVREAFVAKLRSASAAHLLHKPAGRRWSAIDHLRHMLFAQELYTNRWMLRKKEPFSASGLLPHFLLNKEGYGEVGAKPAETADGLEQLLSAWETIHARTRAFMEKLTEEVLRMSVKDISFGQPDIGAVFRTLCGHDMHHTALAEEAVADAGGGTATGSGVIVGSAAMR
jgi:hypothetical protein